MMVQRQMLSVQWIFVCDYTRKRQGRDVGRRMALSGRIRANGQNAQENFLKKIYLMLTQISSKQDIFQSLFCDSYPFSASNRKTGYNTNEKGICFIVWSFFFRTQQIQNQNLTFLRLKVTQVQDIVLGGSKIWISGQLLCNTRYGRIHV